MSTSPEMTDAEMDAIVASSESSSNRDIPMSAAESAPEETPASPETESTSVPTETPAANSPSETFEFNHSGKTIKATLDQLIKWAQQGYDYPQKAQRLNQQYSQWQEQQKAFEQKFKPYQQIDEWATKHPEKWNSLQTLWKQQETESASKKDPYIQALEQKLESVIPVVQQVAEERAKAREEKEDLALDQDIKSIREKYKDLDFDNPGEDGKSLELQVLEHARTHGIPTFRAAFLDFYHDKLVERAQTQAKQAVAKGVQTKTKQGILGESPSAVKKSFGQPKNIKSQSYEDLAREAIEELSASG